MFYDWISISLGLSLLVLGYLTFLKVLPRRLPNPDITLFHLKVISYMSFLLVVSGIVFVLLGLLMENLLKILGA